MIRPVNAISEQINVLNAEFDAKINERNIDFEYLCALIHKISQFKHALNASQEQDRNLRAKEKAHKTTQELAATHHGFGFNMNTAAPLLIGAAQIITAKYTGSSVGAQAVGTFGSSVHGVHKEGIQSHQTSLQGESEHTRSLKEEFNSDAQRARQAADAALRSWQEAQNSMSSAKRGLWS